MKYSVNVTKTNNQTIKAYVSVVIENAIVIKGIKIVNGKNGLFIRMPQYKNQKGKYKDYCFILDKNERKIFEDIVFKKYESGDEDV
ncbi:MAG: septation protein SpoVG family protein [Clostridia bacterium]